MEKDESYLAQLVLKDVQELENLAKLEGVRAYLRKPQRKIKVTPNRNFLQKTLHNVAYRNQKTEEDMLWKARSKQLKIKKNSKRKQENLDSRGKAKTDCLEETSRSKRRHPVDERIDQDVEEEELGQFLLSCKKRGRGGIGSRHDFVGPFPPDDASISTKQYGPEKPDHLKHPTMSKRPNLVSKKSSNHP